MATTEATPPAGATLTHNQRQTAIRSTWLAVQHDLEDAADGLQKWMDNQGDRPDIAFVDARDALSHALELVDLLGALGPLA
jgi:hypothetical protein